jgi:Bacteriocin-protection, YdeI or OmpD-Associated
LPTRQDYVRSFVGFVPDSSLTEFTGLGVPKRGPSRSTVAVCGGRSSSSSATTNRTIELPDDFRAALDADLPAVFESLRTPTAAGTWIEKAKREETRHRRVRRAIELLRDGVRAPDA